MFKIFNQVYNLMKDSFPKEEYRPYKNQKKLIFNPNYNIICDIDENEILKGFISYYKMKKFNFIEHFAVNKNIRGQGIGSKMLSDFINKSSNPIILEVELPTDILSSKRIKFYNKHNFILNTYEYYQLPLREGEEPIPMYLMSYPNKLSLNEFKEIKNIIYKKVYSQS